MKGKYIPEVQNDCKRLHKVVESKAETPFSQRFVIKIWKYGDLLQDFI